MSSHHRSQISRRTLLAGAMATSVVPAFAQNIATNPDVVIIGAGAAGIAAARNLIGRDKSVVVVEASNRVGGRAHTESKTFGVPFDHGCSWINAANANPYKTMADEWGYELIGHDNPGEKLYVGGRRANASERRRYDNAWVGIQNALNRAGQEGLDVSAASVIPQGVDFSGVCQTWIGAMDYGVDFDALSTQDNWNSAESKPSFLVRQGHGSLVARAASGLPIFLETPARKIQWGGKGVQVETPEGTISAKACIVTVSTGVLASSSIQFEPALPLWKQTAIDHVPMGLLIKTGLQFDGERFGLRPNDWLTHWVENDMPAEACYFLNWPMDQNLMFGFIGGAFGWELSKVGNDAVIDFAMETLSAMLGSEVKKHFIKGTLTNWASDPFTLGAYAAAKPGYHGAREELAKPLGNRVYFAGEAVAGPYVALCGGAHISGDQVAGDVARMLG